ncbi:MAG: PSD1 and planctomycete cytochrome C domain-containing protein [Pirellulaceae bacterium]
MPFKYRSIGHQFLAMSIGLGLLPLPGIAGEVDYARDIKPLLSNSCYTCHGPDAETREAELRLDNREDAIQAAIVPGKPDESELLARIASDDPDLAMPPADSNRQRLNPEQVELVRQWIASGAAYDKHWGYEPPTRPMAPVVEETATPIDAFVRDRLKQGGLQPAPTADRRTLIRRLSFDLIGLPPTPEEVEAFVGDDSDDASARLVDRLLESPHYGERMAINWLDLVRYADSVGIHGDQEWSMSPYRDYVINAFNENMPFDQFTVEQLAGDLLPEATLEQRVASGYNRLNMITAEGGAQAKEYLAKYAADRVRTTSTAWMGATVGCAECHDHKFDPYTIKEFYQFAAYFADLEERGVYSGSSRTSDWGPKVTVPTPEETAALKSVESAIAALESELQQHTPELAEAQAEWESTVDQAPSWRNLEAETLVSEPEVTWKTLEDGSLLATGPNPDSPKYTLTFKSPGKPVTALRLEVFPDDSLPAKGPGRAGNGNFVLNRLELSTGDQPIPFSDATATHEQEGWPIKNLLGDDASKGWAMLPQIGKANEAVFQLKETFSPEGDQTLTVTLTHNYGSSHAIGRLRLSVTEAEGPVKAGEDPGVPEEIRELIAIEMEKRTDEQKQQIAAYYRTVAPLLKPQRDQLAKERQTHEQLTASLTTSLVSVSVKPREMRVLPRGNWLDDSGEPVEPAVPGFLGFSPETNGRQSRLDLAQWMVDRRNPLVARVFVNRLWQTYFGRGLVSTADDFGAQGSLPSHPELLDWLAVEFIESGWDIKHMVRLIVQSETYRQSSERSEELRRRDPANQWLASQSHFRFPAELVRDNALSVSGLLVNKIGGVSARPYQPPKYWSHLNFPSREYQRDSGEGLYRRGLYTHWQRTFLHPSLAAFDAPTREECTVRRVTSNTPLQALVLMNDPTYVEAARALAVRLMQEGGDSADQRISFAMQAVLQRTPNAAEAEVLLDVYENHLQQYREDPQAAEALHQVGEFQVPKDLDKIELAAWISVARVVLNLHESINRY